MKENHIQRNLFLIVLIVVLTIFGAVKTFSQSYFESGGFPIYFMHRNQASFSAGETYTSGLSLQYVSRSDENIIESKKGLNAKIMSPCYIGNGSGNYTITSFSIGTSHTIRVGCDLYQLSATGCLFSGATSNYISYEPANNRFNYRVNSVGNYITYDATPGMKDIVITRAGQAVEIFVDGVSVGTVTIALANNVNMNVATLFRVSSTYLNCPVQYIGVDSYFYVYLNDPTKPTDISGNQRVFNTSSITSANSTFDYNDGLVGTGFSTWVKAGSPDIQLAYFNGAPCTTPNTGYMSGYTHLSDTPTDTDDIIIAPNHRIDFNPYDSTDVLLTNFDRSNTTYHNATARAGSDYNASEPFVWQIEDISDPYIYYSWKNNGYAGMVHSKITNDGENISLLDEMLVYSVDKKNNSENIVQVYCGINNFTTPSVVSYTTDANGYINLLDTVNSDWWGSASAKTPYENFAIIQPILNNSRYTKVTICDNPTDIYYLSQPIISITDNQDLDINCDLRPMEGLAGVVAQNIAAGATTFTASSAANFNEGEWISVTDDDQLQTYDTYRGWSGEILDITGNVITLDNPCGLTITAASNARFAHANNVVIVEADSIDVNILGEINGNSINQYQYHPVRENPVTEQQRAGCGITFWKTAGGSINGKISNSLLHNCAVTGNAANDISGVIVKSGCDFSYGHDKNIVFKYADDIVIEGGRFNYAIWEDGVTFYSTCNDATITGDIECDSNARYGFAWNNECTGLISSSTINASGNTDYGLIIRGGNSSFDTILTTDRILIDYDYTDAINFDANRIEITGCVKPLTTPIVWLHGNIQNINMDYLSITGCTGIGIVADELSGGFPDNVTINGGGIFSHTGDHVDIAVGSDVTFTNFTYTP